MILVDWFCCQGGSAAGYAKAGFQVIGVDIQSQQRFPGYLGFVQGDAIRGLERLLDGGVLSEDYPITLANISGFAASCPCQGYSDCQRIRGREHPKLIEATRYLLQQTGKPYIIENVPGARDQLIDPIMLCGAMFPELRIYRHRLFEANFELVVPEHPKHIYPQVKMGRPPKNGEWVQAVGNFSGVQQARDAMGIQWMNREGLRECIPPAYTEFLGCQLKEHIERQARPLVMLG